MHTKIALTLFASSSLVSAAFAHFVEGEVQPRQTSNPGGPLQSLSSAVDQSSTEVSSIQTDTSGILSIQTNTVVSTVSLASSGSETGSPTTGSSTTETSASSETSSAPSSSVSGAGASPPRETGYALAAAAAAAGFIGVVAAL
ncbi:hypothetical protein F4804DRAFT_91821 [Jackrogersella minutella]|nr:hypothetical protein F4804DRAFT_91821 [Jackrogersella minutella]